KVQGVAMKIRHPAVIRLAGFLAACLVRLWVGTVRYRVRYLGPRVEPTTPGLQGRYLYVFWHEALLLPAYHYSRPDAGGLIRRHADGELIAEVCRHLRMGVLRGSTRRDGVRALRQLIHAGKTGHLVITPDGPRGPRRRVQPGVVYAAAKTGLPV